jgi:hypothetical protein
MRMPDLFYDIFGICGALLILFGFYRTSIGRWTGKSFWYELDNVAGASMLVVYQLHLHAYISAVLNVTWGIVAFRGLSSFAQRYRQQTSKRGRTVRV